MSDAKIGGSYENARRRRIFISTVGNNINKTIVKLDLSLVHYTVPLQKASRGATLNKAGRPKTQKKTKKV